VKNSEQDEKPGAAPAIPGRRAGKAKKDWRVPLLLIVIILLLASQGWILRQWPAPAPDIPGLAGTETDEDADAEESALPPEEEMESRGWLSADKIKRFAEEYNINTEFLSRLFSNKIIYKEDGKILYADVDPNLRKHPYDWNSLSWEKQRPVYAGSASLGAPDGTPGSGQALLGIDVSRYQGEIDWAKVAGDGISFAMIRAGYRGYGTGKVTLDEYFEANAQGAAAAGVKIGLYFFSQAITEEEAVEEAEFILGNMSGFSVRFPVVFDMEEISGESARTDALTPAQVTRIAAAFCERIRQAGYIPMIYANPKWFVSRMELEKLEAYDKWLAQYYKLPAYPYQFSIWQFSSTGSVAGIKGNVDMNLSFADY
jgi:GH25 family lysozyme M1 (1,4-beta-N-acetylmuramidase)